MTPFDDHQAEAELLGSLMHFESKATRSVRAETGLKPDHFGYEGNREIYQAILNVVDRDDPPQGPNASLIAAELKRVQSQVPPSRVVDLVDQVGAPGNYLAFAGLVMENSQWRQWQLAGDTLVGGLQDRDRDRVLEAREILSLDRVNARKASGPTELLARLEEIMEGAAKPEFPFPLAPLNELTGGGLGRGEHHLVAGHSSHGKSAWMDQLAVFWSNSLGENMEPINVRLYTNEMNRDSRLIRLAMMASGFSYGDIRNGLLSPEQRETLRAAATETIRFPIIDATGWTASEISNDIRLHRPDVAGIDLLHNLSPEPEDKTEQEMLTNASRRLTDTCRQANCLVVTASHLSEKNVMGTVRPRPTLGDIRGSGMIKNAADSVAFVYRQQDSSTSKPLPEGEIILAKVRNGVPGETNVKLTMPKFWFVGNETGMPERKDFA